MPEFHFVRDYQRLVADLVAQLPLDEAMSVAVGGQYDRMGEIECAIVAYAGLRSGMSLLDLGCGSGRLASKISQKVDIKYVGIDIVQALLDYAAAHSPPSYRFLLNHSLSVPLPDASADIATAFSLFTHLLHTETYLYVREVARLLRPRGRLVFSFLEFAEPAHWKVFTDTAEAKLAGHLPHLNEFIERSVIDTWCSHLGFEREVFIAAGDAPWGDTPALGQSVAILRKR